MTAYADAHAAIDVIDSLRSQFTQRDALFKAMDDLVFGETDINIPYAYEIYAMKVHTRLAFFAAHVITSTLCANPLQVQFAPIRQGMPGQENASLREAWHDAAWDRQRKDAAPRRLYESWMFNLVTKGFSVLKTMRRSDRMWYEYRRKSKELYARMREDESLTPGRRMKQWSSESEDYKLAAPFPIASNVVTPESFWYIAGDDGLKVAAEASMIPYSRLYADFKKMKDISPSALGMAQPMNGRGVSTGSDELLTLYQLWDCEDVTYIVEGLGNDVPQRHVVATIKHGLGDPYTRTLCGPYSIAFGIPTGSTAHEHEAKSALWAFAEVLPMLDATLTASGQVAFLTGFPVLKRTPRPGPLQVLDGQNIQQSTPSDEEQDDSPVFEPGMVMPLGVEFAQPPNSAEHLKSFMNLLDRFLAPIVPQSAYGDGPSESGYAQNQRIHMNTMIWSPFIQNAQDAHAHRCEVEDRLIERIGEPVPVTHWVHEVGESQAKADWKALGPSDIDGNYSYRCLIQPTTPGNEELLTRMLGEQLQLGLTTEAAAIEKLGGSYDKHLLQKWVEKIQNSPQVEQSTMQEILQEMGAGDMEMIQQANEQLAALATAGYGGPEQMGGAPGMPTSGPGGPSGGMGPAGMPVAPAAGLPMRPTPAGAVDGAAPGARRPVGPIPRGGARRPGNSYALPGER